MKKYQIETWHMGAIEHNTCNYQLNVTIVNIYLSNNGLTHDITREVTKPKYYNQYNHDKWQQQLVLIVWIIVNVYISKWKNISKKTLTYMDATKCNICNY
jgi:hypothetical protein